MSNTTLHPSPLKESRRILGEKDTNACLSPARSPAKPTLFNSLSPKKQLLPSPSFIAQKRPIAQVDSEDVVSRLPAQENRVEARITQYETPASTSAPDAMNLDIPEQSASQVPNELSRDVSTPQTVPSDPETRKHFIQEKATLLRTRLQSAMRHVQDPQIDRRVSELEEHSRKCPRMFGPGSISRPGAGYGIGTGTQLQQHLEQKYGMETAAKDAEEEKADDNNSNNEDMLSTPRPQQSRHQRQEEQREIIQIEDDETTPTQSQTQTQRAELQTDTDTNAKPSSPTQMLLSSPTYNLSTQDGHNSRLDEDRPHQNRGEATIATSQSSPIGGEGRAKDNGNGTGTGDGDAVDGLLKLMGTNSSGRV